MPKWSKRLYKPDITHYKATRETKHKNIDKREHIIVD